jgi:hypothetical protein
MNSNNNRLHLYEEVLLLALRDKEGSLHFGVHYQFALAGALVAELMLTRRITIDTNGRRKFIVLADGTPTGDEILDTCLEKLRAAKRRQQVQTWVRRFSAIPRLKHRAASSLVKRRILKMEEDQILFLFRRKLYPEIDPRPEKRILDKMHEAIFTEKREIDPHTLVLIAICDSTGLLRANFDKKRLRDRKSRIKQIVQAELVGKATREAVEAMQAAVMVATIIPAVTVAASAGH